MKPDRTPDELSDADLDDAGATIAGGSGTGKTLSSTLLGKYTGGVALDTAHTDERVVSFQ